jgi:hypothetical protein
MSRTTRRSRGVSRAGRRVAIGLASLAVCCAPLLGAGASASASPARAAAAAGLPARAPEVASQTSGCAAPTYGCPPTVIPPVPVAVEGNNQVAEAAGGGATSGVAVLATSQAASGSTAASLAHTGKPSALEFGLALLLILAGTTLLRMSRPAYQWAHRMRG